jgi:FkbM family methyltransferase
MVPKKILRSARDKFLAQALDAIREVQAQLNVLERMQQEQRAAQEALSSRVQNSGYVQLSETEIMTKIFSGAKLYVDPRDVALAPHLILDSEWEHDVTHAWLSVVKPKDVVLDIGANFGYFGVLAAQQTNRDCQVVLFEANPSLIPYLTKTITVNSLNGCSKIENLAVSDKKGKLTLNILKDYIGSSSVEDIKTLSTFNTSMEKIEVGSTVDVPSTTIDLYCQSNKIKAVNVIKMDIEGHEEKAYAGMADIVKTSPDITLFIEFTKEAYQNPKAFYNRMLKDFGHVYTIDPDGKIRKPSRTDYNSVIDSSHQWSMPIFSKKDNLAN